MVHEKKGIYEIVNDIILGHLEKGVVPWRQTWIGKGLPRNRLTQHVYRGINRILLNLSDYPTNEFVSFKQVKELGGNIRKGERSHMVIFWKWIEPVKDEEVSIEEDLSRYPYIQYHHVWNIAQCDGIESLEAAAPPAQIEPIQQAEQLILGVKDKPEIVWDHQEAYYDPRKDVINVPQITSFENANAYYSVLFHELVHSTGHEKRLARKGITDTIRFGTLEYSFEELIAEMGACYLLSHCGIVPDNFSNNAAYINGWMKKLKQEKYSFIHASVYAQKALDFLLGNEQQA
jgi:antirestriction protein ArdC